MAANKIDTLDNMFDDHPSLSASLEDFEHNEPASPTFRLPSQHSGFKSEDSEPENESNSEEPWSPPVWKNPPGSGWYRHQPYLQQNSHPRLSASPVKSRELSPEYESAMEDEGDYTLAANIPLPRDSVSPAKDIPPSPSPLTNGGTNSEPNFPQVEEASREQETPGNYIRFAVRAEVQHRTETMEEFLSWIRSLGRNLTKSPKSMSTYIFFAILSITVLRLLTQSPLEPPVPDLVKVAGLARSFEPMMFYSEHGVQQIAPLQETGVAVWDLAESVRAANLTSTPLLVKELDELGESLKTLATELTKFFANVDGDIDSILIVMDWAKRELSTLPSNPPGPLTSAFSNIHSLLSRVGMLENPATGLPTVAGKVLTELFGMTRAQRTRATLQRTFIEFLSILEESLNSEITYSTELMSLFSTIDKQFINLQRTTLRESDQQERSENEFLSSLWTRVLGPSASQLRIYERNKVLLDSVRGRTVQNKNLIVEHNGKLVALQHNLEALRRKLVGPLVKGLNKSTISVEEQIRGLAGTHQHLNTIREGQKGRVLEVLFGDGRRRRAQITEKQDAMYIEAM